MANSIVLNGLQVSSEIVLIFSYFLFKIILILHFSLLLFCLKCVLFFGMRDSKSGMHLASTIMDLGVFYCSNIIQPNNINQWKLESWNFFQFLDFWNSSFVHIFSGSLMILFLTTMSSKCFIFQKLIMLIK